MDFIPQPAKRIHFFDSPGKVAVVVADGLRFLAVLERCNGF